MWPVSVDGGWEGWDCSAVRGEGCGDLGAERKEVMELQQRKEGGGEGNAKENRKIHIIEVGYT